MKIKRILQTLAGFAITGSSIAALAQDRIEVRISPNSESTIIGELEARSLAVDASWPESTEPVPGWKPIHYRGQFFVYLDSEDLGKNFLPLPGSKYLLSPSPSAPTLAIATETDKAEIVSIDPRYCHVNLETIVLGYIEDNTTVAPPAVQTAPPPVAPVKAPQTAPGSPPVEKIDGILVSTNASETRKTGYDFKIINTNNETLAYLDHSSILTAEAVVEYVNTQLTAYGTIVKPDGAAFIVLNASSLKKKS